MKKLLALFAALVFTLSLSMAAFAEEAAAPAPEASRRAELSFYLAQLIGHRCTGEGCTECRVLDSILDAVETHLFETVVYPPHYSFD